MTDQPAARAGSATKQRRKPRVTAKPENIRSALNFYRIMSYVTGVFLLLLCIEMIIKYVPSFGYEAMLGSSQGFFTFAPTEEVRSGQVTGFNLSTAVLIIHGWGYVLYLIAGFRLWSLLRWEFPRFILIALGGVVPFLSFVVEAKLYKIALKDIARVEKIRERRRQLKQQQQTPAETSSGVSSSEDLGNNSSADDERGSRG